MTVTSDWYDRHYGSDFAEASSWYEATLGWLGRAPRNGSLIELGCGRGKLLVQLVRQGILPADRLFGIEQSSVAIGPASELIPNIKVGNIEERLPFDDGTFDYVVMTEVIEHLLDPWKTMREVRRILKKDGTLLFSFPNYVNVPWLLVRVLAELVDRPNWIVLQPVDHMWIFPTVKRKLAGAGFRVDQVVGSVFFPPVLYRWEPRSFDRAMNALRLGWLSLHPLLVCNAI